MSHKPNVGQPLRGQSKRRRLACVVILAPTLLMVPIVHGQQATSPGPAPASGGQTAELPTSPSLPRGKKLVLKDGSYQLVREYKVEGDRIRYYSLDSSSWEVVPAALVDWEATKKLEAEDAKHDAAIVSTVRAQEAARAIEPLDIDASLEVAPGVFLPPGENLFVFDGKAVLPLPQAETDSKISKGRLFEQVMVPIPIVPSRHNVTIRGARAKFRVPSRQPEFYFRTADSREPHIELIRAKPRGDTRQIEHLDELMGQREEVRDALPLQKWQVAHGVYRFTLGQPLPPGEYALAQIIQDEGASLYVWDFGVDAAAAPNTK